ncbi:MAG: putative Ig domain-containing protein, partial [Sedimenticolaceae bacterium]
VFALAAMLVAAIGAHVSALGIELGADKYYTWGISSDDVSIAEGSIITEAVLTIHGITNWDNNLHMHIVDNPPLDFVANEDHDSGDFFQDFGGLLSGCSYELVRGDLVITFSRINDPNSWVWDIFDYPFNFQLADSSVTSYSSSLLELIDYAGNGTPFGIGFDPNSADDLSFRGISLQLTVNSFEGDPDQSLLTYSYGNINRAPVLAPIGAREVSENAELSFTISATDPDGDQIEYSARDLPQGAEFENGSFYWRPGYEQAGVYYVLFVARDGLAIDSASVLIQVNNTNRPPVLAPIGAREVSENAELSFTISATDPDGDQIEYSAYCLPRGAEFENGTFFWRPDYDQAGVHYVLFVARDELEMDMASTLIQVNNTNRPPVLAPIGAKEVSENAELSFTISATDPDGDEIEYSAYCLPQGAEFQNGTFFWTPDYDQAGVYYVLFVARDELAIDLASTRIQVNNTNPSD